MRHARFAAAAACAALLSACAGGAGPTGNGALPSGFANGAAAVAGGSVQRIYTCQNGTAFQCLIYDAKGNLLQTITEGIDSPIGVAGDAAGNFYVANEFAETITEYSSGGTLLATYDDSPNVPLDVAVRGDRIAVANLRNVATFVAGKPSKPHILKIPNVLQASGIAFDSKGNCYVAFTPDSGNGRSSLDSFVRCRGKAQPIALPQGSPYGLAFDGNDNLYFTDLGPDAIGLYACTGVTSCTLTHVKVSGPFYLNFSADFKRLFVSSLGTYSGGSSILEINVRTRRTMRTITQGLDFFNPPLGVAAGPGPAY